MVDPDSKSALSHDLRQAHQHDFADRMGRLTGASDAPTSSNPSEALAEAGRITRAAGRPDSTTR